MKRFLLFILFLLSISQYSIGQGTSCSNAIDLGTPTTTAACANFNTSTATGGTVWVGGGACSGAGYGGNGPVTWFRFCTNASAQCIQFNFSSVNTGNMEAAIYATCTAGTPGSIVTNPYTICFPNSTGILSTANARLAPNTCYYLRVRTANPGQLRICRQVIIPPANDGCAGATEVTSSPTSSNNFCYTPAPTDPLPSTFCALSSENTSWFKFTSLCGGTVNFSITNINCVGGGGGFQIGFYTGTCGNLTSLGCNSGSGGTVTTTINNVLPGQTIYILLDGNAGSQCTFNVSATNSTPGITPSVTICEGESVTLTATGGGTYAWSPGGQTTSSITVSPTTTTYYSCVVNSCTTFVVRDTVFVTPKATPTFAPIGPLCSGTVFTLPASSIEGITGTWSPAINTTATTTYTFTPDAGQCAKTNTLQVSIFPANRLPTFNAIGPICSGNSFSLPATSLEGITGTWSPAINNTATTTYTFTPAPGQCAISNTLQVTVILPNRVPTFNPVNPICNGGSFTLPSTSLEGITGAWSPAINNTATTTYTFTPALGQCATTQSMTVKVNQPPRITNTLTKSICSGNSVNLALTSDSANASYTWVGSAVAGVTGISTTNQNSNTINNVLTNNTGSVQTIVYSVFATINGCPGPAVIVSVTLNPLPVITNNPPNYSTCSNQQLNIPLTANPTSSFNWVAVSTGSNITVVNPGTANSSTINSTLQISGTVAQAVVYSVTPTSTSGSCPGAPLNITVTVNPLPVMNSVSVTPICSGSQLNISLSANIGSTFSWSAANNANTTGEESVTPTLGAVINDVLVNTTNVTQQVSYTVVPTSVSGSCPGSPLGLTVTVLPKPRIINTPAIKAICSGAAVGVTISSDVTGSNFVWYAVNNSVITGESVGLQSGNTINDPLVNNSTNAENVTYKIVATANGCPSDTFLLVVTVNPVATVTGPLSAVICGGIRLNLPLSSNLSNAAFSWVANSIGSTSGASQVAQNSSIINDSITNLATTDQTVIYSVTPIAGSCPGISSNISVTVKPAPVINLTPKSICSKEPVNINLSANIAGSSFSWKADPVAGVSGMSTSLQNSSAIGDILINSTSVDKIVTYTVTPVYNGCQGIPTSVNITVKPLPVVTAALTKSICSGDNLSLTLSSTIPSNFNWAAVSIGSNIVISNPGLPNSSTISATIQNTALVPQNIEFSVTATSNPGNCMGEAVSILVTVNPRPVMSPVTALPVCSGSQLNIPLSANIPSSYSWTAANNASTTGESVVATSGTVINDVIVNASNVAQQVNYTVVPASVSGACPGSPLAFPVTILPKPRIINTPVSKAICSDGFVGVTVSSDVAGAGFVWYAINNPVVTGESVGFQSGNFINDQLVNTSTNPENVTYKIVSTANGCPSDTFLLVVTVNPVARVTTLPLQSICSGTRMSFPLVSNLSNAYFSWLANSIGSTSGASQSLQNSSIINDSIVNLQTTDQTVIYVVTPSAGSCPGVPANIIVTVKPVPVINLTPKAICSEESVNVTLSSNIAGSGFTWKADPIATITGISITNQSSAIINDIPVNSSGTDRVVSYTVIPDYNGCSGIPQKLEVTVKPLPVVTNTLSKTICSGDNVNINLTASPVSSFSWIAQSDNPNLSNESLVLQSSASINDVLTNNSTSVQTLKYDVTPRAAGCNGKTATVIVTVNPVARIISNPGYTVCSGVNPGFNLISDVGTSISWFAIDNSQVTGESLALQNNSSINDLIINTGVSDQLVRYKVTASYGNCAGITQDLDAIIKPAPVLGTVGSTSVCSGNAVNLNISVSVPAAVTWQANNNNSVDGESSSSLRTGNLIDDVLINNTLSPQDVTYEINAVSPSPFNCSAKPLSVTVRVNPLAKVISNSVASICSKSAVGHTLISNIPSSYNWKAQDNPNTSGENITGTTGNNLNDVIEIINAVLIPQQVVYDIIPTGLTSGCPGEKQVFTVTVNPLPTLNIPSGATICSKDQLNINLSSNILSRHEWVAITNADVTGESTVTQNTNIIDNTLINKTNSDKTVLYDILPFSQLGNCKGEPVQLSVIVRPEPQVTNISPVNICARQNLLINLTSNIPSNFEWQAVDNPLTSGEETPVPQTTDNINQVLINNTGVSQTVLYAVTPTSDPFGCKGDPTIISVAVGYSPDPEFEYDLSTYCKTGNPPILNLKGKPGGVFAASPAGLSINPVTGAIDPSSSAVNTYTVTYSLGGACPSSSSRVVTITNAPDATFNYNGPFCSNELLPVLPQFISGASAGLFTSSPAGLVFINQNTGEVDLANSVSGNYQVTNTIAPAGGCASAVHTKPISIVKASTVADAGSPLNICGDSVRMAANIASIGNGSWSVISGSGTFINPNNPNSDVKGLSPGQNIFRWSISAIAPCPSSFSDVVVSSRQIPEYTGPDSVNICSGAALSLILTSNIPASFEWIATDNPSVSGESYLNPSVTSVIGDQLENQTSLEQSVKYSITPAAAGCVGKTATLVASLNGVPSMTSPSAVTICSGSGVNLNLTSTIPANYTWNGFPSAFTSGQRTFDTTSAFINDVIINSSNIARDVTYSIIPLNGNCPGTPQVLVVSVKPLPKIIAPASVIICDNDKLNISLSGDVVGTTFSWKALLDNPQVNGESIATSGTAVIDDLLSQATSINQDVIYEVRSNAAGCTGETKLIPVTVKPSPKIIGSSISEICSGNPVNQSLQSNIPAQFEWYALDNINVTGEYINSSLPKSGSLITDVLTNSGLSDEQVQYTIKPSASGCTGSTSVLSVKVKPLPVMTGNNSKSVCSGEKIDLPLTSNIPSAYSWIAANNASTTGESLNSQIGNIINDSVKNNSFTAQTVKYYVTPIAANCPGPVREYDVVVNYVPDPSFSYPISTYCQSGSDPGPLTTTSGGSYTVLPSSGLAINGSTGLIDLSASSLGGYVVKYSFAGLCPSEQTFNITITDAPDAKFSYPTTLCSVGANPLPVFTPGASAGRFYSNNPALKFVNDKTGEINLSQSISGNYRIFNEILAAGGCAPDLDSFDIDIIQGPTASNAGTSFSICNTATALAANTPVVGTGTWSQVSGTPAIISNINNPNASVAGIALGSSIFRWTISGTSPCVPSFSDVIITAINGPVVTSPSTAVICSGDNLSISLTSDFGTDFYWQATDNPVTTGESTQQVQSGSINDAIIVNSGNTEQVQYTVIPFAGNCVGNPQSVTVTVNPRPVLNALPTIELCSNQPLNVSLTANTASTFRWSASDNPQTTGESTGLNVSSSIGDVISNPTLIQQTVNYQITPVGVAGCSGQSGTMNVKLNPLPQIITAAPVSICSDKRLNVNLGANIPSSITWKASSNNLVIGESIIPVNSNLINDSLKNLTTIAQQIIYSISPVSLAGGCSGPNFNLVIDLKPKDDASFSYPLGLLCKTGNDMLPVVTGLAGGTYTSTPSGLQMNSNSGLISPAGSISNDYVVTYTTNGNCPAFSTKPIRIIESPKADFLYPDNGVFCSSSNLKYLPILGAGATSGIFVLTPSGIRVNPQTGEIDLLNNAPGTYVVTNIVPATPGCPLVRFNDTITVVPQPNQANAGIGQTVCGTEVQLSGNVAQNGTGSWSLVSGSGNITAPLSPSVKVTGLSSGSNIFRWTITGIPPCASNSSQVNIVSIPKPIVTGQKYKAICSGEEANLQLSANVVSTFSWKAIDNRNTTGESLTNRSGDLITDRITNLAADGQLVNYQVTPTSLNGNCQGEPSEVNIGVMPVVKVNAGSDSTAILGKPHQLNASGAYRYLWSPVSVLNNPFIANPQAVLNQDTRFIVEGTDEIGCKGYDTVFLKVYKGPTYYVPNAFSPNGDGLNDVFRPIAVGIEYTEYFRIYNRWGKLIHQSNDFLKGWNGSYNGIKQPIGAYVWAIRGKSVTGEFIDLKGTVILVH